MSLTNCPWAPCHDSNTSPVVVLALSLTHLFRQFFKTALLFAVEEGKNSKVVRLLLERKANINAQDTQVTVIDMHLGHPGCLQQNPERALLHHIGSGVEMLQHACLVRCIVIHPVCCSTGILLSWLQPRPTTRTL